MDSKANDQRPWLVELPVASVIRNFQKIQNIKFIYIYIYSFWRMVFGDARHFVENVFCRKCCNFKHIHHKIFTFIP